MKILTRLYLKSVTFGFPFKNESLSPNTMFKKLLLSASVLAGIAGTVQAQTAVSPCGADDMDHRMRAAFPEQVAKSEAKLQRYIDAALNGVNLSQYAKVTYEGNDTVTTYHIPLVFHVIHEYGRENVKDNEIYNSVAEINEIFNKLNADTTVVLPIFRKIRGTNTGYIGKTKFVFHLAQRDPFGQPTNGITRRRHYVTLRGGDFGKLDGWARDSYVNIWINKYITTVGAAAYAYQPATADNVFLAGVDGVMVGFEASTSGGNTINNDNTIAHELGHVFSLAHPWGNTNQPGIACGDDGVDDTPPTKGHPPTGGNPCNNVAFRNDSSCSYNKATIGKIMLDSASRVSSTTIGEGVSFRVYTNTLLDSVSFYPSAPIGSSYTVQIKQNNTLLFSKSDTTEVAPGKEQRVGINTKLPTGDGLTMSFAVNPGSYKDTVKASFTTSVPGAIYFTADTAIGSSFNYFHKWTLRYGYFKLYDSTTYRSLYVYDTTTNTFPAGAVYLPNSGFLVDYPDTANAENVMDYTYCSKMFTHGQATRMRLVAAAPVAQRNNLSTLSNLIRTGIYDSAGNMKPRMDLPPVADFSLQRFPSVNPVTFDLDERMYVQPGVFNLAEIVYKCTGESFRFTNQSHRDTVSSISWDFGAGATPATSDSNIVTAKFNNPGYATVSLTANSNAGSNTTTRQPVYLADKANTINPAGYLQEFNADQNLDRWPMFNYYKNDYKWEFRTDVGMYDKTSVSYRNFDPRVQNNTNIPSALSLPGSSPSGDFDDFFSPPFNLTDYRSGNVNINFYYANASRGSTTADIRDTLAVFASTDCGNSWQLVGIRSKGDLVNNGTASQPFSPMNVSEWSLASMDLRSIITANSTAANVLFRFRYRPGTSQVSDVRLGTGNHFYMDRLHISNNPVGVNEEVIAKAGFSLAPNPTNGATSIMLKNAGGKVEVTISDITGKVVYKTTAQGNGNFTKIEVPANAISVRGMYLVQVNSNGVNQTQKLVVN